jgi:hypothetical protein
MFQDMGAGYSVKQRLETVTPHKKSADVAQEYSGRDCQMGKNATTDAAKELSHSLTASATVDYVGF